MALPRPPQRTPGIIYGDAWGRYIDDTGTAPGGTLYFPTGYRTDERLPFDLQLPGYGHIDAAQHLIKLYGSAFRAPNCGLRRIVCAIKGTVNLVGQRFLAGNASLLAGQTQKPWPAAATVTRGQRYTNAGNTYYVTTAGVTAASGGPTGIGASIVDGTAVWRCVAVGTHDRHNPDRLWMMGYGGLDSDGVLHPEGVIREIIRSLFIDSSRIRIRSYSNGSGMADTLLRWYSDTFTHADMFSGVGPVDSGDFNYATMSRPVFVRSWSAIDDTQVSYADDLTPPYISTAAIPPCPGNIRSLHNLATTCAVPQPHTLGELASTGITRDFTASAGSESTIYRYPAPLADGYGNSIVYEHVRMAAGGHNWALNNTGLAYLAEHGDITPRI